VSATGRPERPERLRLVRERAGLVFGVVFAVFAVVNLVNALTKGGDFDVLIDASRRLLDGRPLYAGSMPGTGVTWPPFQSVLFVPAALVSEISPAAAKVLWHLTGLALLLFGVRLWSMALNLSPAGETWRNPMVLMPLAAIALPAQTNFEHQNVNPLLLALLGACALSSVRGRTVAAGLWLGAATALKAFPALVVLYLLIRGKWRTAMAAILTAVMLSALPVFWYGWTGAIDTFGDWIRVSTDAGWPTRAQNQSMFAMFARLAPGADLVLTAVAIAAVLSLLVFVAVRRAGSRHDFAAEIALALTASVLCSPLAWDHYWVLMYPALSVVYRAGRTAGPDGRLMRLTFWTAAVAISGLSRATLGQAGFGMVRRLSNSTLSGLALLVAQGGLLSRLRK
jgi:hypothetical protein